MSCVRKCQTIMTGHSQVIHHLIPQLIELCFDLNFDLQKHQTEDLKQHHHHPCLSICCQRYGRCNDELVTYSRGVPRLRSYADGIGSSILPVTPRGKKAVKKEDLFAVYLCEASCQLLLVISSLLLLV